DVAARYGGDGYFGIPPGSTALHVAAWKGWHRAVALLVERGAPVDAVDGNGSRPLELAVKACVDSYWIDRRQPDSIRTLLEAGASPAAIRLPTGYPEADLVVRRFLPPHPG